MKISYAQNFEDVILARVFAEIANGQYIDIGAAHPTEDSVTKYFYDRGWSGVNFEPNSQYFKLLLDERVRDINLNLAVGKKAQSKPFYCVPNTGLSTFDEDLGEQYLVEFPDSFKAQLEIVDLNETLRAADLLREEFHFLKIDAEGAEDDVIQSIDFGQFTPWVILVEATIPRTQIASFHSWEPKLVEAGYTFVYEDGLNRFYLHAARLELLARFRFPPNLFDEFRRHDYQLLEMECQRLLEERRILLEEREAILTSFSWRFTKMPRWLASLFQPKHSV